MLVVTNDSVDSLMAGPGIRAWELAGALSASHQVSLSASGNLSPIQPTLRIVAINSPARLASAVEAADTVVCSGPRLMPVLLSRLFGKRLVIDLYDPFNLEELESKADQPILRRRRRQQILDEVLRVQLLGGDFFICASERQRDYWLGALSAAGRVDPKTYDDDSTLRNLIDVVPFGLPQRPPREGDCAIKGIMPGVGKSDFVILWGGGLWGWLDPFTPIRAMAIVHTRHPDAKLVFMGTRHPNPVIGRPPVVDKAIALADSLGLLNTAVVFNEGWVPYNERDRYLTDADLGISAHHDHLETRFAFRTRLLDYLWAGLPIVCTAGDDLGDTVQRRGLGITVADSDVEATAQAILRLREDDGLRQRCRQEVSQFATCFTWEQATGPLIGYCSQHQAARRGRELNRALFAARILRLYTSIWLDGRRGMKL